MVYGNLERFRFDPRPLCVAAAGTGHRQSPRRLICSFSGLAGWQYEAYRIGGFHCRSSSWRRMSSAQRRVVASIFEHSAEVSTADEGAGAELQHHPRPSGVCLPVA
jgi:hypothetical protein